MADPQILETLAAFPPCQDMPARLLERLADIARLVSYKPKERIVSEYESIRGLHVVRSGAVLLERGQGISTGAQVAHLLRPGQSFGEVPLLSGMGNYSFDASATEYDTQLVGSPASRFSSCSKVSARSLRLWSLHSPRR